MDIQGIFAIVFFIFLSIFIFKNRKKVQIQKILSWLLYFVMYRTNLGLKFMDNTAKNWKSIARKFSILCFLGISIWIFNDWSNIITSVGKVIGLIICLVLTIMIYRNPVNGTVKIMIGVGFLGMIFIAYELTKNVLKLFTEPEIAAKSVGLVLPFQVKGGFYVPFIYWIICIFILAVVHESAHGIFARIFNIKIKSSGFAFLGIGIPVVPAAFVEPDEKQLQKAKPSEQLAVFAAGPFANILLGFIVLLGMLFVVAPVVSNVVVNDGIIIQDFIRGEDNSTYPAESSGIKTNELILKLDNIDTLDSTNFSEYLQSKKPGESLTVTTNESVYQLTLGTNPEDEEKAYMGVMIAQHTKMSEIFIAKYGQFTADAILWFSGLFFWLYLLNIGIGMFNLVPLGPVDGGRMLRTVLLEKFEKKRAEAIWKNVSMFFLFIILISITASFII